MPSPARALYDPFAENPVLQRILARMPLESRASFTPEQIAALDRAAALPVAAHRIAVRRTMRFFGKRYYVAVFLGADRRRALTGLERAILSGMRVGGVRHVLIALGTLAVWMVMAVPIVLALYVVKSLAGIDLFEGHSLLHGLFW